jgi:hypothetical protein
MLVLCTFLAAAIVGGIAYQTGRNSLRIAAINRLTEIMESQKRTLSEQVSDVRNALITYTYGTTTQNALRDFTAAFDQLSNAQITPQMDKAIIDSYVSFASDTEKSSGTRLDVGALLPTFKPPTPRSSRPMTRRSPWTMRRMAAPGRRPMRNTTRSSGKS